MSADDFDNPLLLAAKEGDLELASRLVADGCDVFARDEAGRTALELAAFHGHVDVCTYDFRGH
jgi:ankyrin repeat protein